jgi:hypothetical protein
MKRRALLAFFVSRNLVRRISLGGQLVAHATAISSLQTQKLASHPRRNTVTALLP